MFIIIIAGINHFFDGEFEFPSFLGENNQETDDGEVSVYFLDVDQGDSILIVTEEKTVLIDAGERDQSENVIADLQKYDVSTIDYIIATHPHSDHIGGFPDVLSYAAESDNLDIKNVIMPDLPDSKVPTTRTYEKFLDGIEANNISPQFLDSTMEIDLGSAVITLLPPQGTDYSSLNDYSICAYLDCKDTTFFFTGDAEKEEEEDLIEAGLINRKADILKAGHHGSRTSSSESLLEIISPKYAVISCGTDNSYGHPHKEAVSRLENYCDKIYRTDLEGTIICTVNQDGVEWSFDK